MSDQTFLEDPANGNGKNAELIEIPELRDVATPRKLLLAAMLQP